MVRELAAGDIHRTQNQQRSEDASSFSNRDQDLSNSAQIPPMGRISLCSLPQELYNNQLTIKLKLLIAQTRIKEWPRPDAEAKNISATPDEYQKPFFP
jgi:hypothetical protein